MLSVGVIGSAGSHVGRPSRIRARQPQHPLHDLIFIWKKLRHTELLRLGLKYLIANQPHISQPSELFSYENCDISPYVNQFIRTLWSS